MKLLEDRIQKDGRIRESGALKLDGFLNRQLDPTLLSELGKEIACRFADARVTKVLTVEPNAIALAAFAAEALGCVAVFAKKSREAKVGAQTLSAKVHSYTTGQDSDVLLPKRYLSAEDRVLLLDDFLIHGSAMNALLELCRSAGATVVGAAVAVEYRNAKGGERIRTQGVRVEALSTVASVDPNRGVTFC